MAPKVAARLNRPETAPEYASAVEPAAQESAAPVSKDGGHSTETGTEPERVEVGASAGNPEGHEAKPVKAAARVMKLPQARAREDWRARWERIDLNAMRASLASVLPIRGPFFGLAVLEGTGPPV